MKVLHADEYDTRVANNHINIKTTENEYVDYKNKICLKPWGYEHLVFESKKIGMWFLKVNIKACTSLHCHFNKDTIVFVIQGCMKLRLHDEILIVNEYDSVFIPKYKFHSIGSFSPETYLLEMEIFSSDVTFSDKNDLLRIDDVYKRPITGYGSSVKTTEPNSSYFFFENGTNIDIFNTKIKVETISSSYTNSEATTSIIIDGSAYIYGNDGTVTVISEGTVLDERKLVPRDTCTILSLTNHYMDENRKIIYNNEHLSCLCNLMSDKITLTAGCFDVVHIGHLYFLKNAKSIGNKLMVCLSNDEQIRRLKGNERPVNLYEDRIAFMKTIPYVDYIIMYNETNDDSEEELDIIIKIVKPDVWVKGGDYIVKNITEKHPSIDNIHIINLITDKSTSNIINTIRKIKTQIT
jgi:rfaE bifunctional protein nucleotidyltransferase chain/domain